MNMTGMPRPRTRIYKCNACLYLFLSSLVSFFFLYSKTFANFVLFARTIFGWWSVSMWAAAMCACFVSPCHSLAFQLLFSIEIIWRRDQIDGILFYQKLRRRQRRRRRRQPNDKTILFEHCDTSRTKWMKKNGIRLFFAVFVSHTHSTLSLALPVSPVLFAYAFCASGNGELNSGGTR